jgi:molybdopterin molybdotransferase
MLTFEAARTRLLESARPVSAVELIDLTEANGRVLAQALVSPIDVPAFANSAMDGYAVRCGDVSRSGSRLPVALRIAAGDHPSELPPGAAARIFTGAPIPAGCDAVVMQEDCQRDGDWVVIDAPPVPGQWIRPSGGDMRRGATILARGTRLTAPNMALAAAVGIGRIEVYRRLRVALFSTGSELKLPGELLAPGQIYNSNRYLMLGMLRELGADIIDLGIVPDSLAATRAALREAAERADVIVSSGGMSVGEEDHVVNAVRTEGQIDVWKVAYKPGKPIAYGRIGAAAFIGLPGNPVSAWVGMLLMVIPFLRRCLNQPDQEPWRVRLRADFDYAAGNRLEFIRVRRNAQGGLDCFPDQDSSLLSSAAWCDGLAAIPAEARVASGDLIDYLPLAGAFRD